MAERVENETFCQRVVAAARIRPEKVAMMVIGPDGTESITFGAMLAQIRSIAYRLGQEKIAFGDRVALIGENHPDWAIAYLGIIYRGAVVTPLDPAAATQALGAFLKGAAILATELDLPIVPVALDGAYRIWPRKSWRFRLAKVKISFGEPIDVQSVISGETDKELAYEKVTVKLKQRIEQMLDEMRANKS